MLHPYSHHISFDVASYIAENKAHLVCSDTEGEGGMTNELADITIYSSVNMLCLEYFKSDEHYW